MIMAANGPKSKRQSVASFRLKPPEPFIVFLDRSLGKNRIASALRQAGVEVHVHDDHFSPDARDVEWLQEVGRRGWVVFTKDHKIRYRSSELATLIRANVRTFVLTGGNLQGEEMSGAFVKALPTIRRFVSKNPPPFVATVTRGGSVSMVFVP
jgi:predicted nuclease of predicted toxin-antitoxin system